VDFLTWGILKILCQNKFRGLEGAQKGREGGGNGTPKAFSAPKDSQCAPKSRDRGAQVILKKCPRGQTTLVAPLPPPPVPQNNN